MSTSTGTELAKRGPRAIARVQEGWSEKEVALIKATCAPDLSADEFDAFCYVARERGLNPLKKEIYAIRRGGRVTHQTGIDGYRVIAARTKLHAGTDDAVFSNEPGRPGFRATVTVHKIVGGVRCPFVATARWEEYNPGQGLWKTMPHSQLGKCAEALALRKAFPEALGGLYTADEMAQADVVNVPVVRAGTLKDLPAPPPGKLESVAGADLSDQAVLDDIAMSAIRAAAAQPDAAAPERTARKRKAEPAVAPTPTDHGKDCGCDRCWPPGDVAKPAAQDVRSVEALGEKISREQQKLLFALAKEQGLSHDRLKQMVKMFVGVDSTSDIPKANFDSLTAYVEAKPAAGEVTA